MTEKKYTAPFTAAQVANVGVGTVVVDRGVKMRITRIGAAYIDETKRPVFDAWATPVQEGSDGKE